MLRRIPRRETARGDGLLSCGVACGNVHACGDCEAAIEAVRVKKDS